MKVPDTDQAVVFLKCIFGKLQTNLKVQIYLLSYLEQYTVFVSLTKCLGNYFFIMFSFYQHQFKQNS